MPTLQGRGVEENFGGVESHAARWVPWPLGAIAIELTCRYAGDKHMPVVLRAIGGRIDADCARCLGVIDVLEAQLNPCRMLRVDTGVTPLAVRRRPQWKIGSLCHGIGNI